MEIIMNNKSKKSNKTDIKSIKFHADFMAFANDGHTQNILEEAARKIWKDCPIAEADYPVAQEFLNKKGFPNLLLIDLSDEIDLVGTAEKIVEQAGPNNMVIAIGSENEVSLYRELLEVGLTEYLVKPVTAHEAHRAIHRALDKKHQAEKSEEEKKHEQIVFIGTRGGVGVSTLCVNTAWTLAEEMNHDTALIDLDPHFGTTALALDLQPCSGLRDALKRPERLDDLLLSSAMADVTKKLSVLAMEENPNGEIRIDPLAASFISETTKAQKHYTIVDLPRTSVQLYDSLFAKTEHLVIVSDLSLSGIRDCVRLKKIAHKINPKMAIHYVVNRAQDTNAQISQKDFERGIGEKVEVFIPDDPKAIGKAANAGCAVAKIDSHAKSVVAIKKFCESFSVAKAGSGSGWIAKLLKGGA